MCQSRKPNLFTHTHYSAHYKSDYRVCWWWYKLDSKWQNWYIHKPSCKLWKPAWSTWSDTFNTTKVFLLTRNTVTFWVFETDFWNNAIRLAELKFKRNPVWHRLMNFLRQTTSKHYKVSIYTRGYTLWGN